MIPAYNCSAYLRQTLESVLACNVEAGTMQIEVIDDHSTDANVEELVKEIGGGRIGFYRQEKNVGSLRNFETCINRAKGKWVHILHGDDAVHKEFYSEIKNLFLSHPEAGAAFTGLEYITETGDRIEVNDTTPGNNGIIRNWLPQIAVQNLIQPPAIVVKREVYEKIGSFFGVHYGEDWEMWVRIAAHFPVAYSPRPLAIYRYLRANSISNSSLKSGQNLKDILKVIDTIQNYLPAHLKERLKREAKANYANYFANCAQVVYKEFDNRQAAFHQAKSALSIHVNKTTIMSMAKLCVKISLAFLGFKFAFQKR
jgi:glycosyltransferase involved in cell wall biosynthesis